MLNYSFECMCDNLHLAQLNRERVARDYGGRFYRQQERAVQQCPLDQPLPDSVVIGELSIPFNGLKRYVAED